MPTYEFRCPDGHDFERFYSRISDAPSEVACPECSAVATRQISGGAGLVFKGTGFYITDYGKDGKKDLRERQKAANGKGSDTSAGAASSSTSSSGSTSGTSGSGGAA